MGAGEDGKCFMQRGWCECETSCHFCLPSDQGPSGKNLPGPPLRSSPSRSLVDALPGAG